MAGTTKTTLGPATLERELALLLDSAGLSERQARAVSARLGWDGNGVVTLAAAAQHQGYSRERVRQLEAHLRDTLTGAGGAISVVRAAVQTVERLAPDSRAHIARELADAGISERPFDPTGVLSAAAITGVASSAYTRDHLIALRGHPAPETAPLRLARRLTSHNGATSVAELAAKLHAPPDRIRRLLVLQPNVHWLAGHDDWLRVSGGDRRIANTLRKMLSISSPLTLADAHDGLRRSFRPVLLPAEKLRRVCESLGWLTVDHDRLTVSTGLTLDQKRILSPVERRLVSIFRSAGPVLSFRRAVDLGVRSGLNRNTVGVYLTRTPILQTVERGRYALRGWPTTAAV